MRYGKASPTISFNFVRGVFEASVGACSRDSEKTTNCPLNRLTPPPPTSCTKAPHLTSMGMTNRSAITKTLQLLWTLWARPTTNRARCTMSSDIGAADLATAEA